MSIKIESTTPIVPEVGKSYYAQIQGLTPLTNPYALVECTILSIGAETITLKLPEPVTRSTYLQGDVYLVEQLRPTV